ncbi:MAG: ROK family protein [Pirellulaceae bacterium]|nr:ROK family protein [Pirellulaceae bacterium]
MSDAKQPPYWMGFDLGGTKMLAKIFDANFQEIGRERKRTKGHGGIRNGLERIEKTIQGALSNAGLKPEDLSGIGVGFPGPVDMDRGVLLEAVNLGWQEMPLREFIEKQFSCRAVIANDVDLGVYGEYRFGAGRGARCVVGVFPGTGIGGGCVYEGKIFRGTLSSCMEIGHLQIDPHGHLCGCGHFGCLETEASRLAIAAEAAKAAYRGEAPHLREHIGADLQEIRSGMLAEAIRQGDTAVDKIVRRAAEKIGVAVGNLVTIMCPDTIILGGGLVEAMPQLFVEVVHAMARETAMSPYRDLFRVVPAELGDDAGVLGAAAWAADCLSGAKP